MPFDVVGYYESQAAAALTPFAAVSDETYKTTLDDLTIKAKAAFLAGILYMAVSTPKYMEFRQPGLGIPYRSYRTGLIGTSADYPAAFTNLFATPLPLYPGVKMNAYAQNATNEVNLIAAWLSSGRTSTAELEAPTPTHLVTGYNDGALTAGAWTGVEITWDQDLPEGRYAVVGMDVGSYIAAGWAGGVARLNLVDVAWRPGVIIDEMTQDKTIKAAPDIGTYAMGKRWPYMSEISFAHDQMPNLEMLSSAALTDHVVNLLLQKIG